MTDLSVFAAEVMATATATEWDYRRVSAAVSRRLTRSSRPTPCYCCSDCWKLTAGGNSVRHVNVPASPGRDSPTTHGTPGNQQRPCTDVVVVVVAAPSAPAGGRGADERTAAPAVAGLSSTQSLCGRLQSPLLSGTAGVESALEKKRQIQMTGSGAVVAAFVAAASATLAWQGESPTCLATCSPTVLETKTPTMRSRVDCHELAPLLALLHLRRHHGGGVARHDDPLLSDRD